MKHKSGKLIVIEGGDGSGKKTQTNLLLKYLKKNKIQYKSFDFPRYESFYGKLISRFLRGEFGNLREISPYFTAMLFALDRLQVKDSINRSLQSESMVVVNRYIPSNIAHQGARFTATSDRQKFIEWIEALEYGIHQMPREDAVVFLKVPSSITADFIKKRTKRSYLQGGLDILEKDEKHRKDSQMMYNTLSHKDKNWIIVNCTTNGRIKTKDEIHKDIIKELRKKRIL